MTAPRRPVAARTVEFRGEPALELRAGDYVATFLPHLGMLGASLRWRGGQYLSLHGGLEAFRNGHTTAMGLLAPWANRLASDRYRGGRTVVDLSASRAVHRDAAGLPIHGTMVGDRRWQMVSAVNDDHTAALVATFGYDESAADLFAAFPFPHEIEVAVALDGDGLRVRTRLRPTSRRSVPVSFGWHPYYRLPGVSRSSLAVELPARHELELDARQLPTGHERRRRAEVVDLAGRSLDHGYRLGRTRMFRLVGAGRSLTTTFDHGYGFGQVFSPTGRAFVAIEPMTAPTNALVTAAHPTVDAGAVYTAEFTVRIG